MKKVGKYPADAKVYIDYKLKKIGIKYPVRQSEFQHLMKMLTWFIKGYLSIFAPAIIIFYIIAAILKIPHIYTGFTLGLIWFMTYPLVIILYYSNKKYFGEKLPLWSSQLNAALMKKYEFTFKKTEKRKITIPLFQNNMLQYTAKKDFAKYLKSLKIEPIKAYSYKWGWQRKKRKLQTSLWFAVFEFTKTPKKGSIWVRYI